MALGTDGTTLYVGNVGGDPSAFVDLNLGRVVDTWYFPPIPRNGTANLIYPRVLGMAYSGSSSCSDGSQWKLINGNLATIRPAEAVVPVRLAGGAGIRVWRRPADSRLHPDH